MTRRFLVLGTQGLWFFSHRKRHRIGVEEGEEFNGCHRSFCYLRINSKGHSCFRIIFPASRWFRMLRTPCSPQTALVKAFSLVPNDNHFPYHLENRQSECCFPYSQMRKLVQGLCVAFRVVVTVCLPGSILVPPVMVVVSGSRGRVADARSRLDVPFPQLPGCLHF